MDTSLIRVGKLEKEAMNKFKLKYPNNEHLQATRSRADVKKKICRPGLKKHGMTISRRGPNLRKGEQKIRHKKKRYKMEFVDDFVHPSESRKVKEKSGRRKNNGRRDVSSIRNC